MGTNTGQDRKPWHRHFETVGSIVAIVVGVAALYVSWDQGRVMRQEVRASVWPAVQTEGYVDRSSGDLVIGLKLHNAGVGPARIERLTLRSGDEIVDDISDLLQRMPDGADRSVQYSTGRIMAAGETLNPFELRYPADSALSEVDAVDLMRSLSEDWATEVCYCSVLDQCWVGGDREVGQREVERCDGVPASSL
ncbi:hypothetical protein [Halomonas denitrificans]|nr:hypothetical protein [Halomonas denitrificans]